MTLQPSQKRLARIAGLFYLLIIIFGLIAQVFVRDGLVDYRDATATARNISSSELFYRFGFVCELLMLVSDIVVTVILYILLRNTIRNLALLSTCFRMVSISILSLTALTHYASVLILKDAPYLSAFDTAQQNALALLSVKMHGSGYNISLLFFGFHLLILGYLIYKSGIFPKVSGILLSIGGFCYVSNSIIWFLFPGLVATIYPAIILPCFVAELFFCLWLLIKGIKVAKPT